MILDPNNEIESINITQHWQPKAIHPRAVSLKLRKDIDQKVEPKDLYTKIKRCVFFLLERPETNVAMLYHLLSFMLIIGSLVISVLVTIEEFVAENNTLKDANLAYELVILSIFSIEFLLRIWSCSYVSRYNGIRGRLLFMKSVYMIIDFSVIISTLTAAVLQINTLYVTVLRITRFLQILRLLRMDRQRGDLRFMINVVRQHSKELITCYFVGFIILFSGSYVVYLCEKLSKVEDKISNMADGLYWAMITVTSVGYGDFSPTTWAGKFAAGVFAIFGCAFFSLPAGILGSGFALMVDKQKKERRFIKTRHPAAILIQTCWRNHKLKREALGPIWYSVLSKLKRPTVSATDTTASLDGLLRREFRTVSQIDKTNYKPVIAGVIEEPFNSTHTQTVTNSKRIKSTKSNIINEEEELILIAQPTGKYEHRRVSLMNSMSRSIYRPSKSQMHVKYRGALRFIMRIKYWYSVRCFKNARHPYVNVQDILDKTAHGNTEMLNNIKEMKTAFATFQEQFDEMRQLLLEMKRSSQKQTTPYEHETISEHMEDEDVAEEYLDDDDVNEVEIYIKC